MKFVKQLILATTLIASSFMSAQQPQTNDLPPLTPPFNVNATYVNGVAPGYAPTSGTGLVLNIGPGTVYCSIGSMVTYSGGTLTLTANSTNYVYLNGLSSCAPAFSTSAFTTNQVPVAIVTTGSSSITGVQDVRTMFSNAVTTTPTTGCPTTGCTFTGPVILAGDPTVALQAVTKQYVDNHPFLDPLGFGCVPNSTASGDMTANVTCLQTLGNTFGRIQLPAGQWNVNSCVNFTNNGGFILEGAGVSATSIIQQSNSTCTLKFSTGMFPNEFRISDMTIGHANNQTAPTNESSNSSAPAIFFTGPSGTSIFNYELSRLAFTKSSRGVELDHSIGGTTWGYDINSIRANSDLQGAVINLCGTGAGNPRIHLFRIFNTATLTTEPSICISQGGNVDIDDIEDTPSSTSTSQWSTAFDFSGSGEGTVRNVHIENFTQTVSGAPLISAENGNLSFEGLSASIILCPSPLSCNSTPATSYLVSNIAGGGSITLTNTIFNVSGSSSANSFFYGMRYNTNVSYAECKGVSTTSLPTGDTLACVDPSSDPALAVRNNNQLASTASAPSANSWAIASVATSSGGAAVYTGTFTGCVTGAVQRAWITGFVTTPANNGFFRIKSCTNTTLTAINGSAVSETHAATSVTGVASVGLPFYGRIWNGSTSLTENCTPNIQPIYNAISTLWDTYILNFCSSIVSSSQIYTQHSGWDKVWTYPGATNPDITNNAPGLSGAWVRGGLSPGDTNGAIPVERGYRNVGGSFAAGDFRISADGGGNALPSICASTNTSFAIGNETMQADQACSFMTNKNGDWYNQNGISTPIVPHTVNGYQSGTDTKLIGGDGTGTSGNFPEYDSQLGFTNSNIPVTNIVPLYTTNGAIQPTSHHVRFGGSLISGTLTITLTGAAVYTSSSSYACTASDNTANNAMSISYVSGSSFIVNGTSADAFRGNCSGN